MEDLGLGGLGLLVREDTVFLELFSNQTVVDESCTMELRQNQPSYKQKFDRVPNRNPLNKGLQNQLRECEERVYDPVG